MSIKPFVFTTTAAEFLSPEVPVFINRVQESFGMWHHDHEFVEINYVSEGTGFQYIEGQFLPVAKGDLFFLPIGVSHVFRPSHAGPDAGHLIVYNCLFDGSHSQPLRRFFAEDEEMLRFIFARYPDQTWLHCKDKDGSFQRIFNTLFEENSVKRSDSNDMMQAELVKLLLLIRRSKENDMAVESGASKFGEDALESVLNLLRRDPVKAVRMRDLAAMAGFSERQFRRQFAACTGMSYTDYVNKLRVEICCDLLLATNEKIAAIARLAGYEDMKHFNRLFKRITGQTPRQIRSMHAARGGVDGQKETRG